MKALLLPMILMTVIGVAAGGLFGWMMKDGAAVSLASGEGGGADKHNGKGADSHGKKADAHGGKGAAHGGDAAHGKQATSCEPGEGHEVVLALPPLLSNLAGQPTRWVRLEASVVARSDAPPITEGERERLGQDIVALLRQTEPADIEGAAGLLNLRSDLQELARLRTDGRSRELVIRGLLIE